MGLNDAVLASVRAHGEDRVTRAIARLSRRSWNRAWRRAYARSADRSSALIRFLASSPATLESALAAQEARRDRDRGQDQALGWLLNLMSGFQLASEHLGARDWLIVDEGFCQRSVALFGYGFSAEDVPLLDRYVGSIPRPDTVVVVDTPVEICEARLNERGWSERLEGLGAGDRHHFLTRTLDVVKQVVEQLERSGIAVIWVDGSTPAPDSVVQIAATLSP